MTSSAVFCGGLAEVAGHELGAVDHRPKPALGEQPEGAVDAGDQAGDGGLAGARIAVEDQVARDRRGVEAGLLAQPLDPQHGRLAVDLTLHVGQADERVELGEQLLHRLRRLLRLRGLLGGLLRLRRLGLYAVSGTACGRGRRRRAGRRVTWQGGCGVVERAELAAYLLPDPADLIQHLVTDTRDRLALRQLEGTRTADGRDQPGTAAAELGGGHRGRGTDGVGARLAQPGPGEGGIREGAGVVGGVRRLLQEQLRHQRGGASTEPVAALGGEHVLLGRGARARSGRTSRRTRRGSAPRRWPPPPRPRPARPPRPHLRRGRRRRARTSASARLPTGSAHLRPQVEVAAGRGVAELGVEELSVGDERLGVGAVGRVEDLVHRGSEQLELFDEDHQRGLLAVDRAGVRPVPRQTEVAVDGLGKVVGRGRDDREGLEAAQAHLLQARQRLVDGARDPDDARDHHRRRVAVAQHRVDAIERREDVLLGRRLAGRRTAAPQRPCPAPCHHDFSPTRTRPVPFSGDRRDQPMSSVPAALRASCCWTRSR